MKKLLFAVAATAFATSAVAQMPPYAQLDTNADGSVSQEEAKAGMPDMTDEAWKNADKDSDNKLSETEYSTMMEGK